MTEILTPRVILTTVRIEYETVAILTVVRTTQW